MLNKKYIIHQFDELGSQRFRKKQKFLRKIERKLYYAQIRKKNFRKINLEKFYG
jgi:hypothetical protein